MWLVHVTLRAMVCLRVSCDKSDRTYGFQHLFKTVAVVRKLLHNIIDTLGFGVVELRQPHFVKGARCSFL